MANNLQPSCSFIGFFAELPQTLVSKNINLAERCALLLAGDISSFFLNGDGGVPVWSDVNYVPSVFLGDEDE